MSESAKNLANFKQYVHELSDHHLRDIAFLIIRGGLDVPLADAELREKYHEEGLDEAETQALAERERAAILGEVDAILISDTLHVLDDRLSSAP